MLPLKTKYNNVANINDMLKTNTYPVAVVKNNNPVPVTTLTNTDLETDKILRKRKISKRIKLFTFLSVLLLISFSFIENPHLTITYVLMPLFFIVIGILFIMNFVLLTLNNSIK